MFMPVNRIATLEVDSWLRRAGRWLLPPRCLLCGEGGHGRDLCASCAATLPRNRNACLRCAVPLAEPDVCGECQRRPPAMTETRAAFVYGFPLDRLAPRFKFHRDLAAGRLLAELMADEMADAPRPDAFIPVPLHRRRLRRRGYDQALELAKPLSRALRVPLLANTLERRRATAPQSELDAAARQRNLRNAFAVVSKRPMPHHVVLIDDVMTTGATLRAAARALLFAGAQRVDAWVCARVP
jgi:ComF family protein